MPSLGIAHSENSETAGFMSQDWRSSVQGYRHQIIQKIKTVVEKLVAPGLDDAAREAKLNQLATKIEANSWRDATTRHDYSARVTKMLAELETKVTSASEPAAAAARPRPSP